MTLGNTCIGKDFDFYGATIETNNGNSLIIFNCTMQAKWATYVPATWSAVNQTSCTSNSQCPTGQCCNNNNASYAGLTNSNWEPDNYCMPSTSDTTLYNFTSNVTGISYQVEQMCLNTANTLAGIPNAASGNSTTATSTNSTTSSSGAQQLVLSMVLAVILTFMY